MDESGSAYRTYGEWKGWNERKFGELVPEAAGYFAAEMALAGLWPLANRSVLEIGFGNGEFARWASSQGARYCGTERIGERVAAARAAGFSAYPDGQPLTEIVGANPVDAVVAFDVFEHLELSELKQLLNQVGACLRPGGLMIARVPSGDSPFARAIQYGDVTHKTVLGSSAVRQIATHCGLEVVQVREPAFPIRGQGLGSCLRRALVKSVRAMAFPVLRSLFLANDQAVLTPNMVFVLRRPG